MTLHDAAYAQRYRLRPARTFEQSIPDDELLESDRGRAELVAKQYGRYLAYVPGRGWQVCTRELVWEADPGHRVMMLIADVCGITSEPTLRRAEGFLRHMCAVPPVDFIEHTDVLHCADGKVLLLRTGELRDAEPEDFCQWSTGIRYRPTAGSAPWTRFLSWVLPDDDTQAWVQRWFGYCISPRASEEKIMLLHGPGGDGKSTLLEAIAGVFGKYAQGGIDPALVLRGGRVDHPTEVASLNGKRLAWINELSDDAALDEAKLKRLVSTGFVRARFIARDFIEVPISWKFVITTNTMPDVVGVTRGTWRRIVPVQLRSLEDLRATGQLIYDPSDPNAPTDLKELLAQPAQQEAILNWLVDGYQRYMQYGLEPLPGALQQNADSYRDQEDRVGDFVMAHLAYHEGGVLTSAALVEMLRNYRARGVTAKTVGQWLEQNWGATYHRHADGTPAGGRGWRGVQAVSVPRPSI